MEVILAAASLTANIDGSLSLKLLNLFMLIRSIKPRKEFHSKMCNSFVQKCRRFVEEGEVC